MKGYKIALIACLVLGALVAILVVWGSVLNALEKNENLSYLQLNFIVEETGEKLNGEVLIDDISYGETADGKLTILKANLFADSKIDFDLTYKGSNFSFVFGVFDNYLSLYDGDMTISKEQLSESNSVPASAGEAQLYFYDYSTTCPLNGEIFIDNKSIGTTKNGYLSIHEGVFRSNFKQDSELKLKGITGECFARNSNLPFVEFWGGSGLGGVISDIENSLQSNITSRFYGNLTPRQPRYPEELEGFVRPAEAKPFLGKADYLYKFTNKTADDLTKINSYMIRTHYYKDSYQYGQEEYWATPNETLTREKGDCEDWSLAYVSLVKSYDPKIKCYNILTSVHLTVFCYIGSGDFVFYDQEKTEIKTRLQPDENDQDRRIKLRQLRHGFFDVYGIAIKDQHVYGAFDDKSYISFNQSEEFIDWALTLM